MDINVNQIIRELNALGSIGWEEGVGTTRTAYSAPFCQGRDYVKRLMEEKGLKTKVDAAGNLSGYLEGREAGIISIGSHIDTVPGGGIYDGALGVIAGIEALGAIQESDYQNRHTLEVIAFTEEEGNIVGGTFGSKCFTGQPQEDDAVRKACQYNVTLEDIKSSRREPGDYKCYLELHIEQGRVLEEKQIPIGIVEGIVGIARYKVTVDGEANHAGSTPMYLRNDALVKAALMITRMMEISARVNQEMTCTIGELHVWPGAVNVIPGKVEFVIELRCLRTEDIRKAVSQFMEEFREDFVHVDNFLWQNPTIMAPGLMEVIRECCKNRNYEYCIMPSGAGHDGINMAQFTPSAMLFIPSIRGISHSCREKSSPDDVMKGSNILLDTILALDSQKET